MYCSPETTSAGDRAVTDPEGDALAVFMLALPDEIGWQNAMYGRRRALTVWHKDAGGVLGADSGVDVIPLASSFDFAIDGGAPQLLGRDVAEAVAQLALVLPADAAVRTRAGLDALAGLLPPYVETARTGVGDLTVTNTAYAGQLIVTFTPDPRGRGGAFSARESEDGSGNECELLDPTSQPVPLGGHVATAATKVTRILAPNPMSPA